MLCTRPAGNRRTRFQSPITVSIMTQAITKPAAKTETKKSSPEISDAWRGFKVGLWQRDVNVRWFLQSNYTPYEGDDSFLAPATERTRRVWNKLEAMFVEERKKGVLD